MEAADCVDLMPTLAMQSEGYKHLYKESVEGSKLANMDGVCLPAYPARHITVLIVCYPVPRRVAEQRFG